MGLRTQRLRRREASLIDLPGPCGPAFFLSGQRYALRPLRNPVARIGTPGRSKEALPFAEDLLRRGEQQNDDDLRAIGRRIVDTASCRRLRRVVQIHAGFQGSTGGADTSDFGAK